MNCSSIAGNDVPSSPSGPKLVESEITDGKIVPNDNYESGDINRDKDITPQLIDEHETKLKERIDQCKNIIESLKLQLNEEKTKIRNEKAQNFVEASGKDPGNYFNYTAQNYGNSSMYSASVDSKLCCDENLIEYEKQLQKYQNTLNMAQNEKKNVIRKQMLAKAFKLKLMEVENQCNIELLRVKQSLQCLEPLQIIASKWKAGNDDGFDPNHYELMPSLLELKAQSGSDVNSYKDEPFDLPKDESALSD